MDARLVPAVRPIYVDLDGTLIRSDLLWEAVFQLARQRPMLLWKLPFWAARGKAHLKAELAQAIRFEPHLLPYRTAVLEKLQAERETGRRVVLATAANERFADAIADHLGVFDGVMASDATTNLSAHRKLERIVADCGEGGYDYYGNSADDVCLFEAAGSATVVQPDRAARAWRDSNECERVDDEGSPLHGLLKAMRPHQWTKNVLVFVPIALSHEFLNAEMLLAGGLAFLAFSFAASAVYIVNDLLDLSADRGHRTKHRRPFASGLVPIPVGLALAAGLLATAGAITLLLPIGFAFVLGAYLVATTAYSFALKRMLLIDVLTLAGLYTARIVAGAAAAQTDDSFWLLAFSVFFFLSLALVKRFTEILDFGGGAERSKTGRGYVDVDLDTIGQAGMASGFASVLVLALYVDSAEVRNLYAHPYVMWLLCPLVLYIIVRIWILARRREMNDDPVVFILRDWRSQIMIALGAALFLVAAYV